MKARAVRRGLVQVPHFTRRWQRPEVIQAIFDQISDGIFFYDEHLHLVGVNPSGERMLGLGADDMLGKPCWALFHVAASETSEDLPASGTEPEALPQGTVTLLLNNGLERRVILRNIELRDESGHLEGIVATATDITGVPWLEGSSVPFGLSSLRELSRQSLTQWARSRFVIPPKRTAVILAGALLLILVAAITLSRSLSHGRMPTAAEAQGALEKAKRAEIARFNAMTPAQHFERAKLALKSGASADTIADGLRHLKAIKTSAPESNRARALERDLTRVQNLAAAQGLIDTASNVEVREGVDKLEHAGAILDAVTRQYPNDKDAAKLLGAMRSAAEQLAIRSPDGFAAAETRLVNFTWERGGFGTVMIANFTIRNESPIDIANPKLRCNCTTQDGVVLDQNDGTAYGIIRAHSTARISNVNMGFLSSENGSSKHAKTNCEIVGLKLASQAPQFGSSR